MSLLYVSLNRSRWRHPHRLHHRRLPRRPPRRPKTHRQQKLHDNPLVDSVSAVSVGIVAGRELLDIAYVEDKDADVDFNIVMTGKGQFVEVQGSGEESTFSNDQLQSLLILAQKGLKEVSAAQSCWCETKQRDRD